MATMVPFNDFCTYFLRLVTLMCSKLKMEMKMGVSYKGQWRGKIFDKKGVVGKLVYKVN